MYKKITDPCGIYTTYIFDDPMCIKDRENVFKSMKNGDHVEVNTSNNHKCGVIYKITESHDLILERDSYCVSIGTPLYWIRVFHDTPKFITKRLEKGNFYHYIDFDNFIVNPKQELFSADDFHHYATSNYFLSNSEAQEYLDRIKEMLKDRTLVI